MIILVSIFSMIYYLLCYKLIVKFDKEVIRISKSWFYLAIGISILVFISFSFVIGLNYKLILYSYLIMYLIFQSLIDIKAKKVYCIFNYVAIVVGVVRVAILLLIGVPVVELDMNLFGALCIGVMLLISKLLKLYGGGDGEVFVAISLFMFFNGTKDGILWAIYIQMLAAIIGLISRVIVAIVSKVKGKPFNWKQGRAFLPSITLATYVCIIAMNIIK